MSYGDEKLLVGTTLLGVEWDDDEISFITDKGRLRAYVYGDCCSSTWVESVEHPVRGYPAKVLEVRETELPWPEPNREYDVLSSYGLRVVTENGDLDIDYRNDSNGYYGGSLDFDSYFS